MTSLHSPSTTRRSTPSRRGRAGLAATAVAAAALPFAAACGAGFNSASEVVRPNAAAGVVGDIKVNNVWVIVDPTSGDAEIIGAVANTGASPDQLVSVTANGNFAAVTPAAGSVGSANPVSDANGVGITVSGQSVTIPGGQSVSFGQPGSPDLEVIAGGFKLGDFSTVKLTFAQAGTLTLSAQTESNTGLFAAYNPSAGDTGSPSPSASSTPSASASAKASASASVGASVSASASGSASASATASASPSASK